MKTVSTSIANKFSKLGVTKKTKLDDFWTIFGNTYNVDATIKVSTAGRATIIYTRNDETVCSHSFNVCTDIDRSLDDIYKELCNAAIKNKLYKYKEPKQRKRRK